MAAWNSRGLRGSSLEEYINMTNEKYLLNHLGLIQKIPTPITPIKINQETRQITLAYFEQKSTVDYIGVIQGIPVCFDAKECAADTFPIHNIHEHQVEFMKEFERQDGIAFIILFFSARDEFYYLPFSDIIKFWERAKAGERKSFTYDEIDKSIENLWSVLFTTGYLTHKGCTESGKYRLVIPNKEVRNLFVKKIREWFSDVSRNDGKTLEEFCSAFVDKDSEKIEQIFGDYLWNTISIRDTAVAKEKKENFYHGILLGLLGYKSNWLIKSNAESGIGYSDILVEVPTNRTGIVIEIKYAEDGDLDAACEKALKQIEEKDYVAKLKQDGMKNFIKYGIACFKKICKVVVE